MQYLLVTLSICLDLPVNTSILWPDGEFETHAYASSNFIPTYYIQSKNIGWERNSDDVVLPATASFATATIQELTNIINQNKAADYFSIGDERDVRLLNGEVITLTIVDMSVGNLYIEGIESARKPQLVLMMKQCLSSPMIISSTNITSGIIPAFKTFLESLYNLFPDDYKKLFKQSQRYLRKGGSGAGFTSELWLPNLQSIYSMTAIKNSSNPLVNESAFSAGYFESQYSYFKNLISDSSPDSANTNLIKTLGNNGTATNWWLCNYTQSESSEYMICVIDETGKVGDPKIISSAQGVVICATM